LAGRVLLKITYMLMRWTFGLAALMFRRDQAKNAELLVLRHENAVLRRNAGRIRYDPADRAWFAVLTRFIPRRRWAEVFPVTPATLLAWHRRLAARKYDTSKRRKPGRPATVRSIARLTIRLAQENPLWGYRHGRVRADCPEGEFPAGACAPLSERLGEECQRRYKDQRALTAEALADPQPSQRLARPAGHDQLTAAGGLEPRTNDIDSFHDVRKRPLGLRAPRV
jgi:hypothetical protein